MLWEEEGMAHQLQKSQRHFTSSGNVSPTNLHMPPCAPSNSPQRLEHVDGLHWTTQASKPDLSPWVGTYSLMHSSSSALIFGVSVQTNIDVCYIPRSSMVFFFFYQIALSDITFPLRTNVIRVGWSPKINKINKHKNIKGKALLKKKKKTWEYKYGYQRRQQRRGLRWKHTSLSPSPFNHLLCNICWW